ncbi:MAG: beta-hydroxyacyl-ACP dehydratase [Planctomycetota bacterium]|nr:beta-hydroxyacyl-ACP dehydratase [Planctomycetota bacterium]
MATAPLLDPNLIDLSRTVATHDEIYSRLKQAGRFALLDAISYFGSEDGTAVGWKDIRADDWWAADHIPGRPLFPGVLMTEAAAQLASWDYIQRTQDFKSFLGFAGLDDTRFRGMVEPGVRMHWVSRTVRIRTRMFVYQVQGFVAENLVFETQVIGTIL